MISKNSIRKYNLEYYISEDTIGKFDMPKLYPTIYTPKELIGFANINKADSESCIHFYQDDYQFERIWNRPMLYVDKIKEYDCALTPDFSLYSDMPIAMMIWNIYRSRLIGQIMQRNGLTVIPTVSWADSRSFDFCFDGLPQQSTLSVSTIGVHRSKKRTKLWQDGVEEMLQRLKPAELLIYGQPIKYKWPEDMKIKYYKNDNYERLRRKLNNGR